MRRGSASDRPAEKIVALRSHLTLARTSEKMAFQTATCSFLKKEEKRTETLTTTTSPRGGSRRLAETVDGAWWWSVLRHQEDPSVPAPDRRAEQRVRALNLPTERLTRQEQRDLQPYPEWVTRPQVRGECEHDERPCPFAGCRYHLYLDVLSSGNLKLNHPDRDVVETSPSCVLDVVRDHVGGLTLEDVAAIMNLTRERVRQIELLAIRKIRASVEPLTAEEEEDE